MRGVDAVDVGGGVRPRRARAAAPRASTSSKLPPLARHGGEDVVAGAVDDAVDRRSSGRRRALPSACAGSGCRRRRSPRSRGARRALSAAATISSPWTASSALFAVTTSLPATDRREHEAARRLVAADQLDDDRRCRDRSSRRAASRVSRAGCVGHAAVRRRGRGRRSRRSSIGRPDAPRDLRPMRAQQLDDAGADRAEADQPDPDGPRHRRCPRSAGPRARQAPRRPRNDGRRAPCGCRAPPVGCGARSRSARSARSGRRTRRSRCPATPPPCASVSRNFENSSEPIGLNSSGISAQTNIVALGFGTCQPIALQPVAEHVAAHPVGLADLVDVVLRAVERVRRRDLHRLEDAVVEVALDARERARSISRLPTAKPTRQPGML